MNSTQKESLDFKLYEALLWKPDSGYYLLDEHLNRLAASAENFGFSFSREQVIDHLQTSEKDMLPEGAKVKLYLDKEGT
ncbi:MAG: hypothetical protein HON02_05045, partial [Rhodospirillaceae bacterium]|nr:hypothetical protein [Rhodospirillaceae bacterium]